MPHPTTDANTGIDSLQFRELIVRPGITMIHGYSLSAEVLVFGTGIIETDLIALKQYGGGPALGFYQMEPATHDDIWINFLVFEDNLRNALLKLLAPTPSQHEQLVSNLIYATAMCRIHYMRVPKPLPAPTDAAGMAHYYKDYYNTPAGAADVEYAETVFEDVISGAYE